MVGVIRLTLSGSYQRSSPRFVLRDVSDQKEIKEIRQISKVGRANGFHWLLVSRFRCSRRSIMMCSFVGRLARMLTHAWQRQGSQFVDLLDAGSQVKPHYDGGRGDDSGDLAFLFLNISGDLV